MKVPDDFSKQSKSIPLYRNLIRSIRGIGIFSGFGVLVFALLFSRFYLFGFYLLAAWAFAFIIIFILYIVTQSSVAILDLLSKIEFNTRQH
jgi:hypothetical protein